MLKQLYIEETDGGMIRKMFDAGRSVVNGEIARPNTREYVTVDEEAVVMTERKFVIMNETEYKREIKGDCLSRDTRTLSVLEWEKEFEPGTESVFVFKYSVEYAHMRTITVLAKKMVTRHKRTLDGEEMF